MAYTFPSLSYYILKSHYYFLHILQEIMVYLNLLLEGSYEAETRHLHSVATKMHLRLFQSPVIFVIV